MTMWDLAKNWEPRGKPRKLKCECGKCKVCKGREWARGFRSTQPKKHLGGIKGFKHTRLLGRIARPTGVILPDNHKICTVCRDIKPLEEFVLSVSRSDGRSSSCLLCCRENSRKRRLDPEVREKQHVLARRWEKKNAERVCAHSHIRRSRKANLPGDYTHEEWVALCRRFKNKCVCCGEKKKLTADHVVPVSNKNSSNFISNIQPMCFICNVSKGTHAIDYRATPFVRSGQRVMWA